MRGGRVVALLDFDRVERRERVLDLAVTLSCALGRMQHLQGARGDDLEHVVELARRFDAARRLTDAEIDALPFEMARVPLFPIVAAGADARRGDLAGAVDETLRAGLQLPRAALLVEHAREIADAIRSGRG